MSGMTESCHKCERVMSRIEEAQRFMRVCLHYGVATVSRIDKIIGLFCRISSLL